MKKKVFIIIIVILVGLCVLFMSLNKEKVPATASEFYDIMSQKGYDVQDISDQYLDYDYIEKVYVALSDDYSYQIEYYDFIDDTYAAEFYRNNRSTFESSKSGGSVETSVGFKNYSKYTLLSNSKYMVVSRIGDTAIYAEENDNYRDTIKSALEELGY